MQQYTPIENYYLIGDLHTAALVSNRGSIDWMCLPSFDSSSVFASILDAEKGGRFSIEMPEHEVSCRYLPYTAIVETVFTHGDTAFSVQDFMLPRPSEEAVHHYLIRTFEGKKGKSHIKLLFDPRPNYARQRSMINVEDGMISLRIDERTIWVHLPKSAKVEQRASKQGVLITFELSEGDKEEIIMEYAVASRAKLLDKDWHGETTEFWKKWITEGNFEFSREHLVRSAITLKLMQFYPTGGIIAAPTTSLPEEIGGERNWDYRYVWIRDATFTLYAFYVLGFMSEAKKFFRFIERIAEDAKNCEGDTCHLDLSIMYTIWGQPLQGETVLEHLEGYKHSKPVRIGNGAAEQFQLDVFGSLIDAYYFMNKRGVEVSDQGKEVIRMLVRGIAQHWQRIDSGIWEVRGGDQHFAYSKMMAWIGVERALRMADVLDLNDETKANWEKLKQEIEDWLWKECYDEKRHTFKQHPGTDAQDATNFLFIILHFLSRHDERAAQLIEETDRELTKNELYVYRYLCDDGLEGEEGAFVFCMFWRIAGLAAVGRLEDAERTMKQIEKYIPQSGLMAEEIDQGSGEFLGNFPQAFSHIGYILSSYYIHRYTKKKESEESKE